MALALSRVALLSALLFATTSAFAQAPPPPPGTDAVNPWEKGNADAPAAPRAPAGDTVNPWGAGAPPPPPTVPAVERRKGKPGKAKAAPRAPRRAPALPRRRHVRGGAVADWAIATSPVFVPLDGGGTRIALEVSRKVDISEHRAEGRLVYRMRGVAVPDPTNRLPLLLGHFATFVGRVELVDQGPDADLVIELRDGASATHRVIDTPRGIVLQVDFPKPPEGWARQASQATDAPMQKRSTATRRLGGGARNDESGGD